MALIRKQATCPYCDKRIYLGDCPIVATNSEESTERFGADLFDDDAESTTRGSSPNSKEFNYPVLWKPAPPALPPVQPPKNLFWRAVDVLSNPDEEEQDRPERLKPLSDFAWNLLPARACLECGTPLPGEIGDREVWKIGIVGTTGAGKSHFLAALIKEADHYQGLRKWGISEFSLDETSAELYRKQYESFWHDRQVYDPTKPSDAPYALKRPIVVRMTLMLGTKILLYFYDIDGETLVSRGLRVRHASYLRQPHGLIFLVDPLMIGSIKRRLLGDGSGYQAFIRQADLVRACINDLAPPHIRFADWPEGRRRETPVAIALSKSDLVIEAAEGGSTFTFAQAPESDAPMDAAAAEMAQINKEVREVLGAAGERDLLAAADVLPPDLPITFHAVAPIGFAPKGQAGGARLAPDVKPLRCLDPLIALLSPYVRDQVRADQFQT